MFKTLEEIEIVGGHPAVNLVNTVHGWAVPAAPDYFDGFADFLRWSEMVGLLDALVVRHFRARPRREQAAAFREVRALRESLRRLFAALAAGERLPQPALDHLNNLVRRTIAWRRLAAANDRRSPRVLWDFRQAPALAALGPVVWEAEEFLERGETDRLKECPGEGCGWIFLDTSKNGSRTWCSMKTCGNTAKVRRYRERHRH